MTASYRQATTAGPGQSIAGFAYQTGMTPAVLDVKLMGRVVGGLGWVEIPVMGRMSTEVGRGRGGEV